MQRLKYVCLLRGFGRAAQAFPYSLLFFFFGWFVFLCLGVGIVFLMNPLFPYL